MKLKMNSRHLFVWGRGKGKYWEGERLPLYSSPHSTYSRSLAGFYSGHALPCSRVSCVYFAVSIIYYDSRTEVYPPMSAMVEYQGGRREASVFCHRDVRF